ncbi:MAG: putative DNA-binding domain-containing protein [Deltaproteobacteria bacterium]|nr:putative DNA-binding domain-containing protein [Deltaproteobacteria bacterium]
MKIIGEDRFHNLITDYLIKHPSTSYTLRDVGKKLPDFLGTHPLSGKYPFLPDLARLEWLIIESFDAPDSKTLSVDDLKAFAPDQWPHLTFKFVDSFHLMESGWPVGTLHNRPVSEAKEAKPKSEKLRIWRFDLTVYTRIVDDEEYSLLMMIQKGKPFGDICEALAGTCGFEQAVPTAAKKLSGWLKNGLLKEAKL